MIVGWMYIRIVGVSAFAIPKTIQKSGKLNLHIPFVFGLRERVSRSVL